MKNIEKAFEDVQEGDILEINMSTSPIHSDLDYGFSYEIVKNHRGIFRSSKARVDARKTKIGYNINLLLNNDIVTLNYHLGFRFTKNSANRKAHAYALEMAKEISEKHGLQLIDSSQKDIAEHKKALDDDYAKFQKEQEQEETIK